MSGVVQTNSNQPTAARIVPIHLARFWIVCGIFAVWAILIVGKLFILQIVRHAEFVEKAEKQQLRTFEVAPRRGVLYDRNLRELAMTVQVDSIYAVPSEIKDKKSAAVQLSAILHTDPEDTRTTETELGDRLENAHNFTWIARRVTADTATKVRALNLKGVYFQKEFERFYPDNEIAAQVLGYVGIDDNGLGGVEQKFESQLHGTPGRMYTARDARGRVSGSTAQEPEPGRNLVLTIDENIQFKAERALDHAMERTHALNGTVVVQDVHTGQILALAIRPSFNPNDFRHTTPEVLRNHAVSDVYEPGSTFKLMTYSAALESQVTKPDDSIDCQGGQITLAGRVIHDEKGEHFGVIPVHKALEVSSDVAAVKLALKVGPDRFYQFVRDFGFGTRSGVELPGETRGLLQSVKKWSGSSIGSIAIGQEVGVTPLQLVSMVSTIANGGVYLPPRVLMPEQPAAGQSPTVQPQLRPDEAVPNPLPTGAHRVISTMTAAEMRKMMEGVVLYGTGKQGQLNGYSSGGKTGTAQKIDPRTHTYSKTMHIASFVGIAPVNNPVVAIAVVMDSPEKGDYHGATVSAPVFAEVAQQVLEYLDVPHDIEVRKRGANSNKDQRAVVDGGESNTGDVNVLFAAANDLPDDDPLRQNAAQSAPSQQSTSTTTGKTKQVETNSSNHQSKSSNTSEAATTKNGPKVKVPKFIGLEVRKVMELASNSGLSVRVVGSGKVREQAPAAGTMVSAGTQIVVKCER
jgi:cell division protein FtsI (penicillin-binding protein 3)